MDRGHLDLLSDVRSSASYSLPEETLPSGFRVPLRQHGVRATRKITVDLDAAIGPADLQPVNLAGAAEPEGQRLFRGREVGLAARDLLSERLVTDRGYGARPDGV